MGASALPRPTESELEILQVLWLKGQATVRDVHEELLRTKDAGYTTTLKLMQIMFDKGLVERDSSAKTHIYQPAVSKAVSQSLFVNRMIDSLFSGSPAQLVLQALGNHQASADELEQIQAYLNRMKQA
jgi:BlaI family penicillinase repressor